MGDDATALCLLGPKHGRRLAVREGLRSIKLPMVSIGPMPPRNPDGTQPVPVYFRVGEYRLVAGVGLWMGAEDERPTPAASS